MSVSHESCQEHLSQKLVTLDTAVSERVMEISHSGCKFIKYFSFNQFLLSVFEVILSEIE